MQVHYFKLPFLIIVGPHAYCLKKPLKIFIRKDQHLRIGVNMLSHGEISPWNYSQQFMVKENQNGY